ncbi:MAG: hypothetical protein R8M37_02845 [Alphaproteobacteria bacterium]|nr:hypothetical protein [Alphaproteobacteria bacterium]
MLWFLVLFLLVPVAGSAGDVCPVGFSPVIEPDDFVVLFDSGVCPEGFVKAGEYDGCDADVSGLWCYVVEQSRTLCAAGITKLNTSGGLSFPLYSDKSTSPSIHIKYNDMVCYVDLESGGASNAINVKYNGVVYHTVQ